MTQSNFKIKMLNLINIDFFRYTQKREIDIKQPVSIIGYRIIYL